MVHRLTLILFCWLAACSPVQAQAAQTVQLASRTFWLGEVPNTMSDERPFFRPRRIRWINVIIEADPMQSHTVIHIERASRPASETLDEEPQDYILLESDRLDPRYYLPNYRIFGSHVPHDNPTMLPNGLQYMPRSADAGFIVSCGANNVQGRMVPCAVYATYPSDDGIRLMARLYFPKDPANDPDRFRAVAERMRDLVYCLDVTDGLVDVQKERPTLAGCRPHINS